MNEIKFHNSNIISPSYLSNDQLASTEFREYFKNKCVFKDRSSDIDKFYANRKQLFCDRSMNESNSRVPDKTLLNPTTVCSFQQLSSFQLISFILFHSLISFI